MSTEFSSNTGWSFASFFSFGSNRNRKGHNGVNKSSFHYLSATGSGSPHKTSVRKVMCRYGMGCTHVCDPMHRERFWHPPIPRDKSRMLKQHPKRLESVSATNGMKSNRSSSHAERIRTTEMEDEGKQDILEEDTSEIFPCHECGVLFHGVESLQLHLKRKTAWSNEGLIDCRISCLIDNREWHEGLVLDYSPLNGNHRVSLEHLGEIRWMNMFETAFFIIRRPLCSPPQDKKTIPGEQVQQLDHHNNEEMDPSLAPVTEEDWDYVEDISVGYARAQAWVHKIYGWKIQETGHKTQGHLCITEDDKVLANDAHSSLLYGELLPRGINKAMLPDRLDGGADDVRVVYELGMGIGKVAVQLFLQFPSISRIYGVELSLGRFLMAAEAVKKLCCQCPQDYQIVHSRAGRSIRVKNLGSGSILEMDVGNLLDVRGIEDADIVLLETDLSPMIYPELCQLLQRMKKGAKAFTYLELRKIWPVSSEKEAGCFPFRQLDINRSITDRYATSWSVNRGHHFYLWRKVVGWKEQQEWPAAGAEEGKIDTMWVPDKLIGKESGVVVDHPQEECYYGREGSSPHYSPMEGGRRRLRTRAAQPVLQNQQQKSVMNHHQNAFFQGWSKALRRLWS